MKIEEWELVNKAKTVRYNINWSSRLLIELLSTFDGAQTAGD